MGVNVDDDVGASVKLHYTFSNEILRVANLVPDGHLLIQEVERLNLWDRSTVTSPTTHRSSYGSRRSNTAINVATRTHEELAPWEQALSHFFKTAAVAYKALNPFIPDQLDLSEFQLLRYQPGQEFKTHIDNIRGHRTWGARQLSAILCLNDDYEGGILEFPRQNLRLRPPAGSLLLFPSNFCFPHRVHSVLRGVRYSVVCWFR